MTSAEAHASPSGLRHFTKFLVGLTLVLIFLGGQVKSNDAGLAVPDWPTSFGVNMFLFHWSNWVGGVFYEHVHRLVASSVGFLTIVLVVWLYLREPREWVRLLGFAALVAVILQGVLGGLTVIFMLPTPISVSHAVLAQTFLLLTVVIAYSQSSELRARAVAGASENTEPLMRWALALLGAVYLQLILGAVMRHTESGLAIPDFPTTGGRWIPWFSRGTLERINAWRMDYSIDHEQHLEPVAMWQVLVHFAHRLGAVLVTAGVALFARAAYVRRGTARTAWRTACLLVACLIVQVSLGAVSVWTQTTPAITSVHVATGAALLALSVLAVLRSFPLGTAARDGASA